MSLIERGVNVAMPVGTIVLTVTRRATEFHMFSFGIATPDVSFKSSKLNDTTGIDQSSPADALLVRSMILSIPLYCSEWQFASLISLIERLV